METTNKFTPKLRYIFFLCTGFLGLALPGIFSLTWGTGISATIWIFSFLCLTDEFRSPKQLLLSGVVFLAGYLVHYSTAVDVIWLYFTIFTPAGIALYVIFLLYSYLAQKWKHWSALFLFPAIWILFYFIASLLNIPTLLRLDVLFADATALLQIERYLGSYGTSFVLLLGFALIHYSYKTRKLPAFFLGGGLLFAVLIYGMVVLFPNTEPVDTLRVSYTTGPYVGDYISYIPLPYEDAKESVAKSAATSAEEGAKILAYCEEAFEILDTQEEDFTAYCAQIAAKNNLHMLVGVDVKSTTGGKNRNKMFWVDNQGELLDTYTKSKLIPFFESNYEPGDGEITSLTLDIDGKPVKVSYLICYDSNYSDYINKIDDDTDILFLGSWDWNSITQLHANIVRTLAIQNNITILKPTYDGISLAVDKDGTLLHSSDTKKTGYEKVFTIDLPLTENTSFRVLSPSAYGIAATEIMSILISLLLIYLHYYGRYEKTKRNRIFPILAISLIIALSSDAISWICDGCSRLMSVLNATTLISLIMPFIMAGQFVAYVTEYLRERSTVSYTPLHWTMAFTVIASLFTALAGMSGKLYVFENGTYSDGDLYFGYLVVNVLSMILCILYVASHKKLMSFNERIAAYLHPVLPGIAAVLNMLLPEFSYAFPTSTFSLLIIYVMIQTERMQRLSMDRQISTHNANHDELTGLLNRRAYAAKIKEESEKDETLGIIYADLNKLKYTNDKLGHAAGDQLLIDFAALLGNCCRKSEIYRVGGDEFIVMLPGMQEEAFEYRVSTLLKAVENKDGDTACIGSAFGNSKLLEDLIAEAEKVMYARKKAFHEMHPEYDRH